MKFLTKKKMFTDPIGAYEVSEQVAREIVAALLRAGVAPTEQWIVKLATEVYEAFGDSTDWRWPETWLTTSYVPGFEPNDEGEWLTFSELEPRADDYKLAELILGINWSTE